MTPAERRLRASLAANTMWATTPNRTARTANARQAADDRFDRMVIEMHGELDGDEHAKRAAEFRRAFYASLALKSAKARREAAKPASGQKAAPA